MRHSDVRVTLGTYAHLLVEDLRAAADAHTPLPAMPAAANSAPIEPHAMHQDGTTSIDPAPISEGNPLSGMERETGVEPATLSLGKGIDAFVGSCKHSQAVASPGDSGSADLHSVSFGARFCSPFAAPVLQGFLTVREVAARLSVSTATVYKLCAAGKLAHVRVLGAIRVAPVNLAAFIERQSI